jgi:hypothetical protein
METLFVRKIKTVNAIQVKTSVSTLDFDAFFSSIGFNLDSLTVIEDSPFLETTKNVILKLDRNGQQTTLRCKYTDYICHQNDFLVVKTQSEFESDFEPIEPIMESLYKELNQAV